MKPALSPRQTQVAELVAKRLPNKVIAERLGLSVRTVEAYIQDGAARILREGKPRERLFLWFFNITE